MTVSELRALLAKLPDELHLQTSGVGNLSILREDTYVGYVCFRKGEVVLRKAYRQEQSE